MKVNLETFKYLYEYLKKTKQLYKVVEDTKEEEITFNDLKQYVINTLIDNIEYDLGIEFNDYVDMNNFIEDGGKNND